MAPARYHELHHTDHTDHTDQGSIFPENLDHQVRIDHRFEMCNNHQGKGWKYHPHTSRATMRADRLAQPRTWSKAAMPASVMSRASCHSTGARKQTHPHVLKPLRPKEPLAAQVVYGRGPVLVPVVVGHVLAAV